MVPIKLPVLCYPQDSIFDQKVYLPQNRRSGCFLHQLKIIIKFVKLKNISLVHFKLCTSAGVRGVVVSMQVHPFFGGGGGWGERGWRKELKLKIQHFVDDIRV